MRKWVNEQIPEHCWDRPPTSSSPWSPPQDPRCFAASSACAAWRRKSPRSPALRVSAAARSNSGAGLVAAAEPGQEVAADRRQQVVVAPARPRRAAGRARPGRRAGPSAMPTATARLSSTTGEGAGGQHGVQRGDAVPVGVLGGGRAGVAGGDRGLQACTGRRPSVLGPVQGGQAAADEQPVPAAAGPGPAAAPARRRVRSGPPSRDACSSISATSPCTSGSARHAGRPGPGRAASPPRTARADPVVAGGGRVALVEDQVDRPRAPRPAARASSAARRHLERHLRRRPGSSSPGRCAGPTVASGDQERPGDLVGGQPAEQPQGQRHPGLGGEHRVAGGEDQPQQVVARCWSSSRRPSGHLPGRRSARRRGQLRQLAAR